MYLGIDLGTTDLKAALMEETGRIVACKSVGLQVSRSLPHWVEQYPEQWWQAVLNAVNQLKLSHPTELSAVRAIGLSGQMHGATLLDCEDRPLRPAILWNDTRSDAQCRELSARAPAMETIAGNRVMPGFTAPKLLWVQQNEPDIFRKTAHILLPKDYLRLRLTGEKISEMSDASGTLWLDVAARRWSDDLLTATGLTAAQMPRLVEGSEVAGNLRPDIARCWGIRHKVALAGGAGDNAASAIGVGAISPGNGFVSLGTSGVIFVVNDRFSPNPSSAIHAFCHAIPELWHQMSVMLSAASCLRWVAGASGAKDESALLEEVGSSAPEAFSNAPIFLPYLSGERTPHNDAHAQGVLFGLTHQTSRAALGYAVLEGVAFGLADGLAALASAGTKPKALSLVGGGARSRYWAQLISNVLDVPILTHSGGETGAAIGAARLAQIADGSGIAEVCDKPPTLSFHEPQPEVTQFLRSRLQRFRAIYAATKPLFEHTDHQKRGDR